MPVDPDLLREPPPAGSLMETAYRRLKRSIIELDRRPGLHFTEQAVAGEFGLSKTPVREALARLHRDGLPDVFATVTSVAGAEHSLNQVGHNGPDPVPTTYTARQAWAQMGDRARQVPS